MTRSIAPTLPLRFGPLFGLIFAAISGFFVAKIPVQPQLALVSSVFVLAFAFPSYATVLKWLGVKRGLLLLSSLGLYALVVETMAVKTGYPYGAFSYGAKIGTLLFDAVPWTVFFTWTPLVLLAMGQIAQITQAKMLFGKVLLSGIFLVLIDMVLDPGAVAQEFWKYKAGGLYYGVPLSNFVGWLITGTGGILLAHFLTRENKWSDAPAHLVLSGLLSLTFWTSVCLWMSLWIPGVLGLILVGFVIGKMLWKK